MSIQRNNNSKVTKLKPIYLVFLIFVIVGTWLLYILIQFSPPNPTSFRTNEFISIDINTPPPVTSLSQQPAQQNIGELIGSTKSSSESNLVPANIEPSVLIVGGTDGSGTRRVVQVLTELGVIMVSEDPETYDIHADLVGGWPVIAKPLLQHAKKLNYEVADFPPSLKQRMTSSLQSLLNRVEADSHLPESHELAVGGVLNRPKDTTASSVKYGFKAPIAMVFTPFWAHLLPRMKLLHVLRDGRDIAFSANQGPVEKFYTDFYPLSEIQLNRNTPVAEKAIKLWSDWNTQVYNWSQQHLATASKSATVTITDVSPNTYDYFMLHSEDIISENINLKYQTFYKLGNWVGTNLTPDQICCLVKKGSTFLGSHDRTTLKNENVVMSGIKSDSASSSKLKSRYGKWRAVKDKVLIDRISELGEEGLKTFGYEPASTSTGVEVNNIAGNNNNNNNNKGSITSSQNNSNQIQEKVPLPSSSTNSDSDKALQNSLGYNYNCEMSTYQCPIIKSKDDLLPADQYSSNGKCQIHLKTDYKTPVDLRVVDINQNSNIIIGNDSNNNSNACCESCLSDSACRYFTLNVRTGQCYLKAALPDMNSFISTSAKSSHLVSGHVL